MLENLTSFPARVFHVLGVNLSEDRAFPTKLEFTVAAQRRNQTSLPQII